MRKALKSILYLALLLSVMILSACIPDLPTVPPLSTRALPQPTINNTSNDNSVLETRVALEQQLANAQSTQAAAAVVLQTAGTIIPVPTTPFLDSTISSPSTEVPTLSASTKCKWFIQAYNPYESGDINQVLINGKVVWPNQTGLQGASFWEEITDTLVPDQENILRFTAYNHDNVATWHFALRRGENEVVIEDRNGDTSTIPPSRLAFSKSYALTSDCEFRELEPDGNRWSVVLDNQRGDLYLDGVLIAQEVFAVVDMDISPWILKGQNHTIDPLCGDAGWDGGTLTFSVRKNGEVIYSKSYEARGSDYCPPAYILDGVFRLTPP